MGLLTLSSGVDKKELKIRVNLPIFIAQTHLCRNPQVIHEGVVASGRFLLQKKYQRHNASSVDVFFFQAVND